MLVRSLLAVRDHLLGGAGRALLLIASAAAALVIANSPLAPDYAAWLQAPLGPLRVAHWIDDGLMAVFFLFVGLEVKREFVSGDLATPAARRLPAIAALAGMATPALVFLLVAGRDPALARGWAIAAPTDIAFAIGVLALLGSRVPAPAMLFLTTVAIVDDIGAVAIIAFGYTRHLDLAAIGLASAILAALWALNRHGVRALAPYLALAALLWVAVQRSGVHATVAGVLAAAFVPLGAGGPDGPLERLERALSPWVGFLILPLFAFANAGVALGAAPLIAPLPLAIAAGLFLGKQAGVFGAMRGAVALGLAERPAGMTWPALYGLALLAGIGFTMSLFIGALAFDDPAHGAEVKLGVLLGSALSAIGGTLVLAVALPRRAATPSSSPRA